MITLPQEHIISLEWVDLIYDTIITFITSLKQACLL